MLMGWTHKRISEEIGCARSMVTRDVGIIQKRFREAQIINVTEMKNRQLAELENLKGEAYAAWLKSKGEKKTKTIKRKGGPVKSDDTGVDLEQQIRAEDRAGDRIFLLEIRENLKDQADLVGLAPPKQLNLNDISNRPSDELLGHLLGRLPSLAHALANASGDRGLTPGT